MKAFFKLTKPGISLFVMISGLAGYAISLPFHRPFDLTVPCLLLFGLYLVSTGSFALNQAQEWRLDQLMPRTSMRPLPQGDMSLVQVYSIATLCLLFGFLVLLLLSPWTALLAFLTVIFYNGFYTLLWKKRLAFAAVPGAIPGAMPVLVGYSVNSIMLWRPDCIYLFLIMFLWQMPHFWALSVRYKDDYAKAGFPVLPNRIGVERTIYYIGLYTFAYVALALSAPVFVPAHYLQVFIVIPIAVKVLWEFFKYQKSSETAAEGHIKWLPFFLWTNLSMLVFICAPVFDRWCFYFMGGRGA